MSKSRKPAPRASITVNETVTLTAPNREYVPEAFHGYYKSDPLSLDDIEAFIRVVRRELTPELVTIKADEHRIVASTRRAEI